jgi:hypothetical protein
MKRTDVRFAWLTPALGHEWKRSGGAPRLIPKSGGSRWIERRTPSGIWIFKPYPGAFREFARLRIDKARVRRADILAFANQYGDIIAQPQEGRRSVSVEKPWGETTRNHATMAQWCRTIQHMRRTVDLWDQINDPERHEELRRLIIRTKDGITYKAVHHPLERKLDNDSYMQIASGKELHLYTDGDLIPPARRALRLEINRALADTVTPSHAAPGLTLDLRLATYPVNLLADMWLTFARVVSGEIEERQCTVCPEYLYVGSGPGLRRADSVTCSAGCRQRKKRNEEKQGRLVVTGRRGAARGGQK